MPYLAFNLNNGNEFIFDLVEDRLSLGRNARNEIVIENTYISSFHAELVKQADGAYEVIDLKSANGIFINGKRIERAVMKPGDKVRFGQLDSRYRDTKLPGAEKEARGTAATAEEKREEAQAEEGPGTRTELVQLPKPPAEAPRPSTPEAPKISAKQPPVAKTPLAKPVAVPTATLVSTTVARPPLQQAPAPKTVPDESVARREALQKEETAANERLAALKAEIEAAKAELEKLKKAVPAQPAALERGKEAVASEGHIKVLHTEIEQLERAKTEYAAVKLELDKEKKNLADTKSQIATHYETEKKLREKLSKESRATEEYLATLGKEIAEAEAKLAATKKSVASSEADTAKQAAATGSQIADLTKSLAALKDEHSGLSITVAELAAKRTEHEKHFADISPKVEAARRELDAISKQRNDADAQLKSKAAELADAETKLKAARAETEQHAKDLAARKQELDEAIAARSEQLKVIEHRVVEFEAKRIAAEKHMVELTATDSRLNSANEALKLVQEQQTAAEVALAHLHAQHEEEAKERDKNTAELEALAKQHAAAQEKINALQTEEAAHAQRLADSKSCVEKAEQETAARLKELEAAHQKKLDDLAHVASEKQTEIEKAATEKLAEADAAQAKLGVAESRFQELTKKSAEHVEIESKLANARQTLASTEARHNEINGALLSLLSQRSDHESALARLKEETQHHETELKDFKERTQAEQAQLRQMQSLHGEEKQRFEELRALTAEAETKLTAKRGELEREIADNESALKTLQERFRLLQQDEAELTKKLADFAGTDSRLSDINNALKAVEEQKTTAEKHVLALGLEREEKEKEISLLAERGAAQHTLVQTLGKQRADLEQSVAQLESRASDEDKRFAETEARAKQTEQQLSARQAGFENAIKEREEKLSAADARLDELQAACAAAEKHLQEHGEITQQLAETQDKMRLAASQRETAEVTVAMLNQQVDDRKTALQKLDAETKQKAAHLQGITAKHGDLEAAIARLTEEQATHQKRLDERIAQAAEAWNTLSARQSDLAAMEKDIAGATQRHAELQDRLANLADTEGRLKAAEQTLAARNQELASANAALDDISKNHAVHADQLAGLKRGIEDGSHQAADIKRQQDEAHALLKQAQETRAAEEKKADAARAELEVLVASCAAKQSEASAIERSISSASDKLATAEKRLQELQTVEARIKDAQESLKTTEQQRDAEEHSLADLAKKQEQLRSDIVKLSEQEKQTAAKADDALKRTQSEEAKFVEAQKCAGKAAADLESAEVRRVEMERALQAAKDEEKAVRAGMPGLNAEMAAAQTALQELLTKRSAEESRHAHFASEAQAAAKLLEETKAQHAATTQSHASTEQQLLAVREELAKHETNVKSAQARSAEAETRLAALQKQIQDSERALSAQADEEKRRIDGLRRDEEKLNAALAQNREQLQTSESALDDARKKLSASEARLTELLGSGPRVESLSQAIAELETRHRETSKTVSQAAEQELALQVKLNSLTESNKKESLRSEQLRKEIAKEQDDRRHAAEKAQREAESTRSQLVANMQREEEALSARVKARVTELEEKHEILRNALAVGADETTVIMFGNDLIKRIDLIDMLIQLYAGKNGAAGVDQQLRTLRASFEDILEQHGISEFTAEPGTEVSTNMRARMSVVENIAGKSKAKIVECFRHGFVYKTHGGREVVLRKVEVKTSSV